MPNLVVSSCGTSILSNGAGEVGQLLRRTSNMREKEFDKKSELEQVQGWIESRQKALASASVEELRQLSAEINAIVGFYGGSLPAAADARQDMHFLIGSQTLQGEAVTELLATSLRRLGLVVDVHTVPDLSTGSLERFHWALVDLSRWCAETIPEYRAKGWRVVFNLTGGFKSVQGFLQALSMNYADETVYIYEAPDSPVLRIPHLPFRLDALDVLRKHLPAFRRMALDESVSLSEVEDVPGGLLMPLDGEVLLSSWGKVMWAQHRLDLLGEGILPELSEVLSYSSRFKHEVGALPRERRAKINEQLDRLALFLETRDPRHNPKGLSFKPFKSAGSQHELRAWSDAAAARIFGYFENDRLFTVDRFLEHHQ